MNYKELTDTAFSLHKINKFNEAEKIYSLLLQINPDDVNVLNLSGMLYIAKGDYDSAIKNLSRALVLRDDSYITGNLAKAYFYKGESDNAVTLYNKALEIKQTDDLYYSLGIALKKTGDINGAKNAYLKAIELNPNNYAAYYNLAVIYKDLCEYNNAINIILSAEKINNTDEQLYSLSAEIYTLIRENIKAIQEYQKALKLNNNNYLYLYNSALLYSKISKNKKAIELYKEALNINPNHTPTLLNIGLLYREINKIKALYYIERAYKSSQDGENVCLAYAHILRKTGNNKKSIKILNDILKKNPNSVQAQYLLSLNMIDTGDYEKSFDICESSLKKFPNSMELLHAKAVALRYLNKTEEAKKVFNKVIKNSDDNYLSCISLGMIYLKEKNFNKGMRLYIKRSIDTSFYREYKDKFWEKGVNLKGKTVLLYSDCGYGDTIMFARYIPFLQNIAKKVILRTDKALVSVLKENYPNIEVIPKEKIYSEYDVVMPVMNIAYALNMDFSNIPYSSGYIKFSSNNKYDVFKTDKINVGVFYQGSKNVLKNRSIDYKYLTPLFESDKFAFYSYQIENNKKEDIPNLSKYIKDFYDSAKLLKQTDLLITIDSSIAHLAGALGVKTFLLLPYISEWRWFDDTVNTPWYDSIKIFKQSKVNDWEDVIIRVKSELMKYEK